MGRPDISTFQAFTIPSYYRAVAINFLIALIVAFAVKKITILLDKNHEWYRDIWRRALLQFAFGVVAVSILSFFLVWLYFHAFEKDIIASGYLDYELPFSMALIAILNFYYVAYYFYICSSRFEDTASRQYRQLEDKTVTGSKEFKTFLIVETPLRSLTIQIKDIAMFFILDRITFIRLMDSSSLNDCLSYPATLNDIIDFLDEKIFFRINRKCIINFYTIDSFRPFGQKSLLITLKPEYNSMENISQEHWQRLITVSGDKVTEFKNWMDR